jgi:hypothetical protein
MHLSPEVVDHILSFLQTDISALKSCSQVYPLLSGPAERYLYYRIIVDVKADGDEDIAELSRQLSENPRLRNYVRILAINISKDLVSEMTTMMEATTSILSALPLVNKVSLVSTPKYNTAWDQIHKNFHSVFVDILQQSSVQDVHLEDLTGFPMSIFDTCPGIKTLSLCDCRTFTRSNSSSTCPPLESLSIRGSDDPTIFLWAINHVDRLTSLVLRPDLEEFSAYSALLEACSSSVTRLELDLHTLGVQYLLM